MTQKLIVLAELKRTGSVSRNWCLQNYITRLAAIINDLKEDGYKIDGSKVGNDYKYFLMGFA